MSPLLKVVRVVSIAGLSLLSVSARAASNWPAAIAIGSALPSGGAVTDSRSGTSISLATAKGAKGLLVVFTSNECPTARKAEKRLVGIANLYKRQGVGVVFINANEPMVSKRDAAAF